MLLPLCIPSPVVGGRKKYDREYLLSLRHLRECQEPPEGLFLPGALGLVRKGGGDMPGPMGGAGFYREDRYPGQKEKKVCLCMLMHLHSCL